MSKFKTQTYIKLFCVMCGAHIEKRKMKVRKIPPKAYSCLDCLEKPSKDQIVINKEEILKIINKDVPIDRQWDFEEICHFVFEENNQRLIVLLYDSKQFLLFLSDIRLENGEWKEEEIIPLDWNLVKIGHTIYLSAEMEDFDKDFWLMK